MLNRNYSEIEDKPVEKNPWIYIVFVFGLLLILTLRLFQLQILDHDIYLNKSEDYRLKKVIVEAPRGLIFDRNGEVLATNRMSYSVTIDPFWRDKFDVTIPRLASLIPNFRNIMDIHESELVDSVKVLTRRSQNPEILINDADFLTVSIVEEHSPDLQGIGSVIGQRRYYPHGELACHVIGYMGKLTKNEEDLYDKGYDINQWIGKNGVERYYEEVLKGENGERFLEKNYLNRFLKIITDNNIPDVPGEFVTLTLDYRLQMAAEEAFADTIIGSVVAVDPRNGEVLLMVSSPFFDPNEFTSSMSESSFAMLRNDPGKPLYNRAIQGTYPPGSTFKMVTALAGLENGFGPKTKFNPCRGYYYFGREYDCWNRDVGGHGSLDMLQAMTQSCNVYFYQLGLKLGLEKWSPICEAMGFGQRTGIDLYEENEGNLPSPSFYEKNSITYSPGMILNLSIGQGENDVTPLQLAHYAGIIATKGIKANPHLIMDNSVVPERVEGISEESFEVVRRGMYGVINDIRGTAKTARIPGHVIAGKTGTAQNPHGSAHRIFIAFAPYDNPTIAIACVAENTGDITPSVAVQIVRKILVEYFKYYPDYTVANND
ncbi:penicillin-binding protein 2 [Candidatus Latescibacterota bacterium]